MNAWITPDHKPHRDLERDVTETLSSLGFMIDSATYHDKMKPEVVRRLQQMNCWEAHALRTRADRIAVHSEVNWLFEFECKTGTVYPTMAVEALPLWRHIVEARQIGVPCLYCYRHQDGSDVGFWAIDPPKIVTLAIPDRSRHMAGRLEMLARDLSIPDIWYCGQTGGSGDAYVKVLPADWRALRHWRDQVADMLMVRRENLDDAA